MEQNLTNIRNFVIIAHIDHGKSTLADRFLELTETISKSKLEPQFLDRMNLEKKHGITIKMHPCRMIYHPEIRNPKPETLNKLKTQNPKLQTNNLEFSASDLEFAGSEFILNLIDTPGHVDFSYEVSRALAAVEGAILLVDGTQGIQAQTLSNLTNGQQQGLKIIGAINKIDLDIPNLEAVRQDVANLLQVSSTEVSLVSAKTGQGVAELLKRVVQEIPPPSLDKEAPFKALIFDSQYNYYRGVVAYVKVLSGRIKKGDKFFFLASKSKGEAVDLGYFAPDLKTSAELGAGEIGWIATGLKDPSVVRVGDTISQSATATPFSGYEEPQPMVYAGFYLAQSQGKPKQDFENFRQALLKLKLNDYALTFTPENSDILGRGYRLGFLGVLHLKIIRERLQEEYGLDLIVTDPTVSYRVWLKNKSQPLFINNPLDWPRGDEIQKIEEPWAQVKIVTPPQYLSNVLNLITRSRGDQIETATLRDKLILNCCLPLEETIKNFYDNLKSVSSGYASLDYQLSGYREVELEKLEVVLAGKKFESLSRLVLKDKVMAEAKNLALSLKNLLPRQNYAVPIQVMAFGRIIARETLPALKKDVTGYLYGGDRSRKMKLWKKQKIGKKKLLAQADLEIPAEVFVKLFTKEE